MSEPPIVWSPKQSWEDRPGGHVVAVWTVAGPAPFGGLRCRDADHCIEVCEWLNARAPRDGSPDLQALRKLAEAATPGPWSWDKEAQRMIAPDVEHPRSGYIVLEAEDLGLDGPGFDDPDVAFIAAANPSAVLALLDVLEVQAAALADAAPFVRRVAAKGKPHEQDHRDAERLLPRLQEAITTGSSIALVVDGGKGLDHFPAFARPLLDRIADLETDLAGSER